VKRCFDDYKPFVTSGNDNLFLFNVEDIYEGSSEDQRGKGYGSAIWEAYNILRNTY